MAPPSGDDELRRRVEERIRDGDGRGFHKVCAFRPISWGGGTAIVELDVSEAMENPNGHLHGGAAASLVDYAGTLAIMAADRQGRPGVTTDLNTSFFAPTPAGDTAVAEATVLKIGRTLAFVSVEIRRKSDGLLVAQGRMTKHQG